MSYISIKSDLKRKKWMREGMLQAKSKSFWTPFTGQGEDSIVIQANNLNASEGHTVVFDYDGALAGRAIKGKDTAFGKGEQKRKFSNKITVDRYRLVVDNGDEFDAVDVGDLSLSQHSDSRDKLGDLFIRFKDQVLFDAAQGLNGQPPSHIIDLGDEFSYNTLLDLETMVKTSTGFETGGARTPLRPFRLQDGRGVWLFVVDTFTASKLKKDTGFQGIMKDADVRGNENRLIKGVLGRIGSMMIVEADMFFGTSGGNGSDTDVIEMDDTSVEISGMRRRDENDLWTGQEGYDPTSNQVSRNLILGANALQLAFGKMPDYKFQASMDFGIKSESALEVWMNVQKAKLLSETKDYEQAKLAGFDWGVIAVEIQTYTAP
jgi:hypothetical protein